MDKELAYKKICVFLHDPPEKPVALSFKIAHEDLALYYLSILLGEEKNTLSAKIKKADRIAAAIDRNIENESYIDFFDKPSYKHILQDKNKNNDEYIYELLDDNDKIIIKGGLNDNYKNFISKDIEKVFEDINRKYNNDYEKTYFYITRKLFDDLSKIENLHLINKFPADTRDPNHNIEDHLNLSSAIFSETGKLFIGQFTIGPVQDFITQSRKLKDLWAGSFMLSYFIFNAILPITDELGPTNIIYPDLKSLPLFDKWLKEVKKIDVDYDKNRITIPSIPNLFTVLCDDINKLKNLFLQSENNIKAIINSMKEFLKNEEDIEEKYLKYLDNFIEIYWAITEINIKKEQNQSYFDPELYKKAFLELQNNMAYRKQIRNFNYDDPNIEHLSKCTMCGQRPAIEKIKSKNILKENEKLCCVCLIKRKLMEFLIEREKIIGFSYPSLAGIAAKNFIEKNYTNLNEKIKNFKELLTRNSDIQDNFIKEKLEILENIDNDVDKCLESAEAYYPEFYEDILRKIKNKELNEAKKVIVKELKGGPKYLCSIMMDGDDMGQWIGGDRVKRLSASYHKTLSRILSNLANYILPDIAKADKVQIIYAGGDDLFAFCALENLFDFLDKINKVFRGKEYYINDAKKSFMSMGPDATFSMGICIAHYNENLKNIIEKTREAEKLAKNFRKEKNSLCLYLLKSSGDEKVGFVGWELFDDLKKIKDEFIKNNISNNLFYSLSEFERYVDNNGELKDFYYEDLYRIIKRHINPKLKDEEKNNVYELLKNFIREYKNNKFENLSMLLKIISFITRGE